MTSRPNLSITVYFDDQGSAEALHQLLVRAMGAGAESVMVLASAGNAFTAEAIQPIVASVAIPLFGGVFPAVLFNNKVYEKGTVVIALSKALDIHIIDQLSDPGADFIPALEQVADESDSQKTFLVIVDGYAQRIAALFQDVYEVFGQGGAFLGGGAGAGALSLTPVPCVMTNQGLLADVALLIDFPHIEAVAIEHGWEAMAGPYVVTSATHTRVEALDFMPAFSAYKQAIEAHEPVNLEESNFFDVAKDYPLGMVRYGGDFVVRDTLSASNGVLSFIGEVPENQEVYILRSNATLLIDAARRCARSVAEQVDTPILSLTFDCVSRWMNLGHDFSRELQSISQEFPEGCINMGVLCAGEVGGNGERALEFHNKTVTIGAIVAKG